MPPPFNPTPAPAGGKIVPRLPAWRTSVACLGFLLGLVLTPAFGYDLRLRFRLAVAGSAVEVGSGTVMDVEANRLTVTRVAALVSRVTLVRADGERVQADGQFGLIDLGNGRTDVTVSGLPAGRYEGVEFLLGVVPEVNRADPGVWPAGHALHPLVNGLHWGWQGGYVFVALEGRYQTAGSTWSGWSLHLATDRRLMQVAVETPLDIAGDTAVDLVWDLARSLERVRLQPEEGGDSTHSAPGDALADRLVQTVPRSFRVERVTRIRQETRANGPGSADPSRRRAGQALAFQVPAGWPQPSLPADNPLTREGVELGRYLFSDTRLSGRGTQACVDCHSPALSFSDDVALSPGEDGLPGSRNAMPLFNLAWASRFGWDGSRSTIREQALAAMVHPREMNATPATVLERLGKDAALGVMVREAFGSGEITMDRIGRALEQYLLTRVATDSRFDQALKGGAALTVEERRGFELFMTEYDPARGRRGADCFHCHGGALFSDFGLKNNGLDREAADLGFGAVSHRTQDAGAFKVPSLRNLATTAPYMHDGRFSRLEEVVAHYDHGVQPSPQLDPNLAKHPAGGLALSEADQQALVAFLGTLNSPIVDGTVAR